MGCPSRASLVYQKGVACCLAPGHQRNHGGAPLGFSLEPGFCDFVPLVINNVALIDICTHLRLDLIGCVFHAKLDSVKH